MITRFGDSYVNGMKGKPSHNKGKLKIYNKELNKIKYISKDTPIETYPGYEYFKKKK